MPFDEEEVRKEHLRRRAASEAKIDGLSGMTVNERLFAMGVLAEWDAAVIRKDRVEMVRILRQVEIEDAESTVEAVLKKFGEGT